MKRDKEKFKSKVRDESYIEDKRPDVQLGRHIDIQQNQPITQSKKNRMYQARQEQTADTQAKTPDSITINSDTPYKSDMEIDFYSEDTDETQDSTSEIEDSIRHNGNSDTLKKQNHIKRNRDIYHNHCPHVNKQYDYDFSEPLDQTPDTNEPPKETQKKNTEDYNIRDTAQDVKEHYSKNTDYNFEKASIKKDNDTPFDKVQTKIKKADKPLRKNKKQDMKDYNIRDVVRDGNQNYSKNTDYSFENVPKNRDSDKVQTGTKKSDKPLHQNKKQEHQSNGKNDKTSNTQKSESSGDNDKKEQSGNQAEPPKNERVKKFEEKAKKAREKANKAEQSLPHKTKIKKQRLFDEEKKKTKKRLVFEKEVKPQSDLYRHSKAKELSNSAGYSVLNKIHTKIAEVENDNTAVESAHKAEQKAETLARYSVRTAKYIGGQKKAAPYKKAARLKHKAETAEVKAMYEKALAEHPEIKKSAVKKFMQKQHIKKQYQKVKHAEQSAKTVKKAAQNTEKAASRIAAFVWRHKAVFGVILAIVLLIAWLCTALSSCSVMMSTGFNSIMVSSYFAEDEDIYAAEEYYISLEQDLQNRINGIERTYPNYNEYNYDLAQIGHNPYELISYLTAVYQDFKFNDIKSGLDTLFNSQYHLRITEASEQRTDENGNVYTYKILNVTLTNNGFTTALTADQRELYSIYLASKGNRDYLFEDDIYANETDIPGYMIPGEALTDETFRKLITEAEKYLGYPYVWGGSSPSTSFDCSGFVCWVFKNSGVYPLNRTTAQGIYDQCSRIAPQEAKPGDIIFFKGTYNTSEVSHVGIYVGNGMMIHCGNPIQYASVNTNYWTSHFYAYGRLGTK